MTGQGVELRLLAYTSRYLGESIGRDLADIGRVSWRNNPQRGITGTLIFDEGRFIQVLEGPAETVARVFASIRGDGRTGEVETLFDVRIDARTLPEWSMWVGRVAGTFREDGVVAREVVDFRDAYLRTFKVDAMGFIHLLRALLPYLTPLEAPPEDGGGA